MFLFYIWIYVKILRFERIFKTLITEENKISICSERKVVDNFYTIGITVLSLLIMALWLLFPDSFLETLCNSSHLRPLVYEYFKYYLLAIPFMCYFIVLTYFVKTDNFVQLHFKWFLIANILNVVFDVILIECFNMGISGAALGMALGYLIAAIYTSTYFFNPKRTLILLKSNYISIN